jgi:taurine dioxygenase
MFLVRGAAPRAIPMEVTPLKPTFVANIHGVDVRDIAQEEFEQLYRAWLEFGVLRLRGQPLDEDALQAFSARFGPLEEIPLGRLPEEARRKIKNRYVTRLSNIIENRRATRAG